MNLPSMNTLYSKVFAWPEYLILSLSSNVNWLNLLEEDENLPGAIVGALSSVIKPYRLVALTEVQYFPADQKAPVLEGVVSSILAKIIFSLTDDLSCSSSHHSMDFKMAVSLHPMVMPAESRLTEKPVEFGVV